MKPSEGVSAKPLRWPDRLARPNAFSRLLWGVPFLGPDARAYSSFRKQVGSRSPSCLSEWRNDTRLLEIRDEIAKILVREMEWPSPFFLPEDPCSILFFDPTVDIKSGVALFEVESLLCGKYPAEQIVKMNLWEPI